MHVRYVCRSRADPVTMKSNSATAIAFSKQATTIMAIARNGVQDDLRNT